MVCNSKFIGRIFSPFFWIKLKRRDPRVTRTFTHFDIRDKIFPGGPLWTQCSPCAGQTSTLLWSCSFLLPFYRAWQSLKEELCLYFQRGLWLVFHWTIYSLTLLFQGMDGTDNWWHDIETVRKGRIQVITLAPVQGRNRAVHMWHKWSVSKLPLASKTAQTTLIGHGGITGVNLPLAWKRSVNKEQERRWHSTCPETVRYYYFLIKPWLYNSHV